MTFSFYGYYQFRKKYVLKLRSNNLFSGEGLKNAGKGCWHQCNKQPGPCEYCGTGGCCRKGVARNGCDGLIGGARYHSCVALGNLSGHYI